MISWLRTAGFLRSGNNEKKRPLNRDCKIMQSLNFLVQDLITQGNTLVRALNREEHFLCLWDFLSLLSAQRFEKFGKFLLLQAKIVLEVDTCSSACLDPNCSHCPVSKCSPPFAYWWRVCLSGKFSSLRFMCVCETRLYWNGGFEQKYQYLPSWVTCVSGSEGLSCVFISSP